MANSAHRAIKGYWLSNQAICQDMHLCNEIYVLEDGLNCIMFNEFNNKFYWKTGQASAERMLTFEIVGKNFFTHWVRKNKLDWKIY